MQSYFLLYQEMQSSASEYLPGNRREQYNTIQHDLTLFAILVLS
jgi:hypothetical protein